MTTRISIEGAEEVCMNCKFFEQHFRCGSPSHAGDAMEPVNFGHCTYPRIKAGKPSDTCKHFLSRHNQ